jgi:hypothetical protein|tara:strand:- start:3860 stop:4174 length:315 start_codon:yes stop_codon:yes gene_type:complete
MEEFPDFKESQREKFDSMILAFATSSAKQGLNIERYEIIVQKPIHLRPFYEITCQGYDKDSTRYSSDCGINANQKKIVELLIKEKKVADEYNLPIKIKINFLLS